MDQPRSIFVAFLLAACGSSDPTESGGSGTEKFTTWGEDYIEQGIPSDPTGEAGFVDGWSVVYEKFLVSYRAITVADHSGHIGAELEGSLFVDNVKPGHKDLVTFPGLEAKAWELVSYEITPAPADASVVAGEPADLAMMAQQGYSLYLAGSATKGSSKKTFHWGFHTATRYFDCHVEQDGRDTPGVVVLNGGIDVSELTTHGDHPYYDRLQSSPDPAITTSLRFDAIAAADDPPNGDADGEVTLDELDSVVIDVTKYDPSGFPVTKLGEFVTALSRTIGHYRGEGECTVKSLD